MAVTPPPPTGPKVTYRPDTPLVASGCRRLQEQQARACQRARSVCLHQKSSLSEAVGMVITRADETGKRGGERHGTARTDWLVLSGHLLTGYESHGVGGELASAGRDLVGAMAALAFSVM